MATARENTLRAGLAAKKNQGARPTKNPRSFTKPPNNSLQSNKSKLAQAKAGGRTSSNTVKKATKALGVNRHKSNAQRLRGWSGAAIGGVIGSWLPFVGNVVGAFIGRLLGNSVLGKWILIGLAILSVVIAWILFVTIFGGIMVLCDEEIGWLAYGTSFVNDKAATINELCKQFRVE